MGQAPSAGAGPGAAGEAGGAAAEARARAAAETRGAPWPAGAGAAAWAPVWDTLAEAGGAVGGGGSAGDRAGAAWRALGDSEPAEAVARALLAGGTPGEPGAPLAALLGGADEAAAVVAGAAAASDPGGWLHAALPRLVPLARAVLRGLLEGGAGEDVAVPQPPPEGGEGCFPGEAFLPLLSLPAARAAASPEPLYSSRRDGRALSRLLSKARGYPAPALLSVALRWEGGSAPDAPPSPPPHLLALLEARGLESSGGAGGGGRCLALLCARPVLAVAVAGAAGGAPVLLPRPRGRGPASGRAGPGAGGEGEGLGFGATARDSCVLWLDDALLRAELRARPRGGGGFGTADLLSEASGRASSGSGAAGPPPQVLQVATVELWGLGGAQARGGLEAFRQREARFRQQRREVDLRKMAAEWRGGGGDKWLLGTAGGGGPDAEVLASVQDQRGQS